jgi:hypothetical protein
MENLGSYIWFIGLAAGTIILAIAIIVAKSRKRKTYGGDPNHAWKQAAAESGSPEVANPNPR